VRRGRVAQRADAAKRLQDVKPGESAELRLLLFGDVGVGGVGGDCGGDDWDEVSLLSRLIHASVSEKA